MSKEIIILLNRLGVPAHIKGYKYIMEAIVLCQSNNDIRMTKELYPILANKYNDTPSRVERAIRHAVETTFNKPRINHSFYDFVNEVFGNSIDLEKGKPTNSQFVKTIANYLNYNLGESNEK